jgi:hypothetical protein
MDSGEWTSRKDSKFNCFEFFDLKSMSLYDDIPMTGTPSSGVKVDVAHIADQVQVAASLTAPTPAAQLPQQAQAQAQSAAKPSLSFVPCAWAALADAMRSHV